MSMDNTLTVPIVPRDERDNMTLPVRRILLAESRADEIAIVTPTKAPELLATFNRGYLEASTAFSKVKYELARAEDEVAKVRAAIMIDKIPLLLKEKGLPSSADMRQALVDADPEYQYARERLAFLEGVAEYMKGKMKFLENAYSSVKKIMDTGNWNMALKGQSTSVGEITGPVGGFGQPR